jgi:hypothetical protein
MDAGLLRIGKHFGQRAAGVGRILGMGVEDAAIIVESGQGRNADTATGLLLDIVVNGLETGKGETLDVGVFAWRRLASGRGGDNEGERYKPAEKPAAPATDSGHAARNRGRITHNKPPSPVIVRP